MSWGVGPGVPLLAHDVGFLTLDPKLHPPGPPESWKLDTLFQKSCIRPCWVCPHRLDRDQWQYENSHGLAFSRNAHPLKNSCLDPPPLEKFADPPLETGLDWTGLWWTVFGRHAQDRPRDGRGRWSPGFRKWKKGGQRWCLEWAQTKKYEKDMCKHKAEGFPLKALWCERLSGLFLTVSTVNTWVFEIVEVCLERKDEQWRWILGDAFQII